MTDPIYGRPHLQVLVDELEYIWRLRELFVGRCGPLREMSDADLMVLAERLEAVADSAARAARVARGTAAGRRSI